MSVATVWLETSQGQRWPVASTCSLGRSTSNSIVIDDGKVSRRHALVHKQGDDEYWVIDLGSGNGTYLNGRRITQPTELKDGDLLALGDQALTFRHISGRVSEEARTQSSAQTLISFKSIDCWLLVADIKNSTALGQRLTPTEMAMMVGRWMGSCKEIVDANGGAINKFLGDGFFAYWLAETVGEDGIVETLRSLRALQSDRSAPRFRLALHYGRVTIGGGGSLGEDSLSGPDVVLTFRMEEIAGALGCDLMASTEARQRLARAFGFRPLGAHSVPGFATGAQEFFAIE